MKFQKDDIFTGLFVLVGTLLTLGVLLTILGYNIFESKTEYVLRMREIAGAQKGTLIKLKDYTVGQVEEVEPIYGASIFFKARVAIDSDLLLYRGTRINITKANIIGDTVLVLYPSPEKKHLLRSGDTLFATNIVNLDQMISEIQGLVKNISQMVGEFSKIAGSSKGSVSRLLNELNLTVARANRVLAGSESNIIDTVKNIAKTSATLERFSRDMAANPWKLLNKGRPGTSSSSSALP